MKVVIVRWLRHAPLGREPLRPKPMIEIGGKPMLWHIMKIYSAHGINEFVVCLGYKGYMIKEYFANYALHNVGRDLRHAHNGAIEVTRQQRRALAGDAGRYRRSRP